MTRQKRNPTRPAKPRSLCGVRLAFSAVCWFVLLGAGQGASLAQPAQPQSAENKSAEGEKDVRRLEMGKPIVREIAGGQSQAYQVALTAGQYLKLTVEQRGVDVAVQLLGPERNLLFEFAEENRRQGKEEAQLVAESSGVYGVNIVAKLNEPLGGKYEISIDEIRPATPRDISLQDARRLYFESVRLQGAGKYDEALQSAERGLEIREKILGSEHPAVAYSLSSIGVIYYVKGDYSRVEPLYQRSIGIIEKSLGPDHLQTADLLNNLASLYFTEADYSRAEPIYQRALAIKEKALGPDHVTVAATLDNLALLYRVIGDYVRAEPLNRRALEIREKSLGPEHPLVASSLNTLGILYDEKGDSVKAEPLFLRALAIREKALGSNHRFVAESANNLGNLYSNRGDHAKAVSFYQRALSIWEKALGAEHPYVASALNNMGNEYYEMGEYEKAEPLDRRALAIREKVFGPDHPDVALALQSLADVHRVKGDYREAESAYRRALAMQEKALSPDHRDVTLLLNTMARLYAASSNPDEAINTQLRANANVERNLNLNLVVGSERQKSAYLAMFSGQTDQTLSLHLLSAPKSPLALRMAFTTLLQRKGRGLDVMADIFAQLRRRADAQDQSLFDQLSATASQIANLSFEGPDSKNPEGYRDHLKRLNEEKEKIEDDLSRRSAEFREQIRPVSLEAVQSALPKDGALIEIASYLPLDMKTGKSGEPRYAVYILFPVDEPRWVDLGKAAPINQTAAAFRDALHRSTSADVKTIGRELDEMVMRPVRRLLGQTRHLLLSPDGALNLVPFAALVDEENRYLVERYSVTYLTSGRELMRLHSDERLAKAPMIIADPDFGQRRRDQKPISSTDLPDLRQAYFSPLSETAAEAKALKRILPDATVLTRGEATEKALKQIAGPSVLHIATHGFFLADKVEDVAETERRRKLLQQGKGSSTGADIENPLLRSGLGLAGANLHKSGDDDGILTAMEAAGLNLWGTKLVTLSACETGVGEIRTGEGVYGLRRALALAGAETQVMSLWPVSDLGTRELMVNYYTALQARQGRSEAMRQAQLRMLKDPRRRHPFYWASFIVSGEWANLDGKR